MDQERAISNLKGYSEKIVASMPSGLLLLSADLMILSVNPSFLESFRLREDEDFCELLWQHCCEGMYGAPEYGGNRNTVGWDYIDYEGDVQPRGYSDAEVSEP